MWSSEKRIAWFDFSPISLCHLRYLQKYLLAIPGHAGGQGYEHQPPPPASGSHFVTYVLYVVDPPSPQNLRGPCPAMLLAEGRYDVHYATADL